MNYAMLHSVPAATAMADLFKMPLLQDLAAQRGLQRPTIGEPLFWRIIIILVFAAIADSPRWARVYLQRRWDGQKCSTKLPNNLY